MFYFSFIFLFIRESQSHRRLTHQNHSAHVLHTVPRFMLLLQKDTKTQDPHTNCTLTLTHTVLYIYIDQPFSLLFLSSSPFCVFFIILIPERRGKGTRFLFFFFPSLDRRVSRCVYLPEVWRHQNGRSPRRCPRGRGTRCPPRPVVLSNSCCLVVYVCVWKGGNGRVSRTKSVRGEWGEG